MTKAKVEFKGLRCSFCGKSNLEYRKAITGPNVVICDSCIELCVDIVREDYPEFMKE